MSVRFGNCLIDQSQVFFKSTLSYGLVNLKPIVPGRKNSFFTAADVLAVIKRPVKRVHELTDEEASDLFQTSRIIGDIIEREYGASSLTFVIQDGKHAGQTVPHVHIHVIPRRPNDFQPNDLIYDILERRAHPSLCTIPSFVSSEKNRHRVDNEDRAARSKTEMEQEAKRLAFLLNDRQ